MSLSRLAHVSSGTIFPCAPRSAMYAPGSSRRLMRSSLGPSPRAASEISESITTTWPSWWRGQARERLQLRGGNVTDVSLYLEDDSLMPDQFGELLFGWNLDLFKPESVEIIDDGERLGAHVRFVGRTYPFAFTESFIGGLLNLDHPQLALTYDYELGPEDTELRLTITLYNDGVRTQKLPLPVMMASFGDGAMAYTPGYGFDYDAAGLDIPYYVASGRDLGYGFHPERQDLVNLFGYAGVTILQMDELEVRVGPIRAAPFWFSVSDNGPAGIANSHRALVADTTPLGTVSGQADLPDSAQGREGGCRVDSLMARW